MSAIAPVTLIVGDDDLTGVADELQWSTSDPGGCEVCSFTVPDRALLPTVSTKVLVFVGLECVWEGRVDEPGQNYQGPHTAGRVTAVGAGAKLKDNPYSMIYVDRDLGSWQGASNVRRAARFAAGWERFEAPSVKWGTTPQLNLGWSGAWAGPIGCEAWYDAGPNNLLGAVYLRWDFDGNQVSQADSNWTWEVYESIGENGTFTNQTTDLAADGDIQGNAPAEGTVTLSGSSRYAMLRNYYGIAAGGNQDYDVYVTKLAVYGTHGLSRVGTAPYGLYPADVADHARQQATGVDRGPIDTDANAYVCQHAVYRTPVMPDQVIDDMMKLLGWHWGVWPAPGLDAGTANPQLHLTKPPENPTAWVARSDCENIDLSERLTDMHNRAEVTYTDASGGSGVVTVTLDNPRLPSDLDRTLQLNMGIGDSSTAQTYGEAILTLEQQQSRAAGRVVLPGQVATAAGRKPAALLRAGKDRLRITDLPQAGPWTESDSRRFDTFRIRRTETTADDRTGALKTTVEIDAGANLLETLNARLEQAVAAIGTG